MTDCCHRYDRRQSSLQFAGTQLKNSAICRSTVMTRSGRWVKHFASSIIVVPASSTTASPALTSDAVTRGSPVFQRAIVVASLVVAKWVQNAAAPRRWATTADHAPLIQLIKSRRDSGWRCVNRSSTSCSTVTSVWFFQIRHNEIQTVLSFHNRNASCIASLIDTAMFPVICFSRPCDIKMVP